MKKVYLDNAATTKVHPKVLEKMIPYLSENFGNPSSTHSFGRKVRVAIEESREILADMIGADASEIYFTSGGTEALNFQLKGIIKTEFEYSGKNKLLLSSTEHKAGIESGEILADEGFDVDLIPAQKNSEVDYNYIKDNIDDKTALTSVMLVNNETGIINDIAKISTYAKKNNSLLFTDAVQGFGKFELNVEELGVDALCASAHKIGGPKGIGFAYVKNGTPQNSLIKGGGQERNRRGGTENVAGIIGFTEAAKISYSNMDGNYSTVKNLNQYFRKNLQSLSDQNVKFIDSENVSPYILSTTFNPECYNNDLESILMFLDINGVAISSGSACTSGTLKPSHVITAMGRPTEEINGTIRISFSPENTIEELDYALEVFEKLFRQIKK